jgi:ribulose-phosphate 3-epimerase
MIGNRPIELEVDGGITAETIGAATKAGANVFVAGSAVYKGEGIAAYRDNIARLKTAAEDGRR